MKNYFKSTFGVLAVALGIGASPNTNAANIDIGGALSGTNTWQATNIYTMQSAVYVLSNAVLNIEPGTVIYGTPSDATDTNNVLFSALIVCQGGKVYANGTSNNPIVFTAEGDDLNDPADFLVTDVGQWGGIVLLGQASINTSATAAGNTNSPKYDIYEGAPDVTQNGQYVHRYGGGNDADNSGELRYVSIRHGGAILKPNKEINGLSMCGVGSGTVIEHIEVFANSDDGFEWFGGTVNSKYLISAYCEDEEFDIDQGYRGKGQFWFGIHPVSLAGQFGGEWNGEPNTLVATNTPMGKFTIYNMTMIGSTGADKALRIRDLAAPNVYNAVFTSFTGGGMQVDSPFTNNFVNGNSIFKETLWNTNTGASSAIASNLVFNVASLSNVFANPMLTGVSYTTNRVLDPRPQAGSPALGSSETAPNDGFYTPVAFKGAFNGSDLWARGWTALDSLGFLSTNNPVSVPPTAPTITSTTGSGTVTFSITSESGFNYELQSTLVLNPSAWTNVAILPGNGGTLTFPPVASTNATEFFRIQAQ